MIQEEIEISIAAGKADAVYRRMREPMAGRAAPDRYLRHPSGASCHGTTLGRGRIRGVDAERVYRTSRPPVMERKSLGGEEGFRKRLAELTGPLTPEAIESDAAAYVDGLARLVRWPAIARRSSRLDCYTGAFGVTRGRRLSRTDRRGCIVPRRQLSDRRAHQPPHLLLPRIRARLYFGHAMEDRSIPHEAIRTLEAALTISGAVSTKVRLTKRIMDGRLPTIRLTTRRRRIAPLVS